MQGRQQKTLMDNKHEDTVEEGVQEVLDFTKPSFVFEPKQRHDWRQQGPYLVCKSCEIEHASYIGMNQLLVGLNADGTPLLKNRS